MKSAIKIAGGTLLWLGLAGCSQVPPLAGSTAPVTTQEKRLLVGTEITARLAGKRFYWIRTRDQASGETQFDAGGAMSWKRTDVESAGTGRWAVSDGLLCQEYDPTPKWKGGRVCRKLYAEDTKLVTSPNDGGLVTYTELPAT